MPAYFAKDPKPTTPAKRTALPRESKKKIAHREALGLPQPFRTTQPSGKPIKKKARRRERNDPARISGPKAFRTFLHAHECLGCGYRGEAIQQAHRFTGGTGRKCDWQQSIPLCGTRSERRLAEKGRFRGKMVWCIRIGCHHEHDHAKETWPDANNISAKAAQFWNRWLLHCGREGLDPQTGKPNA